MTILPGLTLYALRHRGTRATWVPPGPRPDGTVIWLHASQAETVAPLLALARRLIAEDGVTVALTADAPPPPAPRLFTATPPSHSLADARAFLEHWQPSVGVLADGVLPPALIHDASARGIPLVMVDGRAPSLPRAVKGWFPGLTSALLSRLHMVMAVDEPAARLFRRAGARPAALGITGRMEHPPSALPANEAERAALSRLLATRPVWLACHLPEAEEALAIEAHRSVLRLAHRMLLIVVPDDLARAPALAARMAEVEGWMVARRSAEEEPEADVQVYVADSMGELGLWYRLAPVTYLGGSLSPGGCRADPLPAAAVGSALLHGPRSGAFGAAIGRLAAAQATALVGSGADLAETLGELLSPDRAARLAQAAWLVTTEGADVTNRVLALIRSLMAEQR
jgi:3-deoxy-D-manno-octulosonic-acid transferase